MQRSINLTATSALKRKFKIRVVWKGCSSWWALALPQTSHPSLFPSWSKIFFPRKIGNHTFFTGEEYMRLEFRLESEPKQLQLKKVYNNITFSEMPTSYMFFYKQHVYKQCQAEIGKTSSKS